LFWVQLRCSPDFEPMTGFLNSFVAVAVPKNRPAALAYVSAFVEDAKASGSVRRALDNAGLKTSTVAPAGRR
jgi:polar amino acid transport system substrate-binding protein